MLAPRCRKETCCDVVGLASESSPSAPGGALDVVRALESYGLRALRVAHTLQAGQPGRKRRCLCAPQSSTWSRAARESLKPAASSSLYLKGFKGGKVKKVSPMVPEQSP